MTTKPFRPLPETVPDQTFPELPPRDDMQNPVFLYDPGHPPALRRHLGHPETTIVLGEIPLGWRYNQAQGLLKPDLLVAFDIDRGAVIAQEGYSIEERGKPPDFVLEVASKITGRNDYTRKREGYADYGVPEYWRFDPTGGDYYPAVLEGDRLVAGAYAPMPVNEVSHARHWGYSEALGLYLCWEFGHLRWYDPAAQRYLRTHDEEAQDRIAAEAERDAERQARIAAEAERDAERQAHIAAEAERDAADTRARELEAELRRLRG